MKILKKILSDNNLPFIAVLTSERLGIIEEDLKKQMKQWKGLCENERLELIFEL
ncbi:MAG: hypothetical protein MUO53_09760 [Maribacter sp.]|nr:hypothetical protein [Maribacter sp.]